MDKQRTWWGKTLSLAVFLGIALSSGFLVFNGGRSAAASPGVASTKAVQSVVSSGIYLGVGVQKTVRVSGDTGGYGNTRANQESSFFCEAVVYNANGSVLGYLTIASVDNRTGQIVCDNLGQMGNWTRVPDIPNQTISSNPVGYVTIAGGAVTVRVYSTRASGDGTALALVADLLARFRVPH